jgi:hypothetical protein
MAHEGVPLIVIHANSATATSASPRSISKASTTPKIIDTVHARRAPMVPVRASLRL